MGTRSTSSAVEHWDVVERIAECKNGKNNELNLSGLGLTSLPAEVGELTFLKKLILSNNKLTALPSVIGQLRSLTIVDLDNNQLMALPSEFGQLTSLRILYIINNQLKALPSEFGQLTSLRFLYLINNKLTALPPEIGQLTSLTSLDLARNELRKLPGEIGRLTSLKSLDLRFNRLSSLPAEIGKLRSLTKLDLGANALTSLPSQIGQLTLLTSLDLWGNQVRSLPAEVSQLTSLTNLDLARNELTTLPSDIGQLTALTNLTLSGNQLSMLPHEIGQLTALTDLDLRGNQLTALPSSLQILARLENLYMHDNSGLKLSPSILGPEPGDGASKSGLPRSILDFYFGRKTGKNRALNELKLILVGRGGAGKTSAVRALLGEPFEARVPSTPGIALSEWKIDGCKGEPVLAHIWDFAGQVITHALHQFFFSERTVYILVLTGRENSEREDAEYWLRLIRAFGSDNCGKGPPVIVALNKWDEPGCRPRVDSGALEERYPFINKFIEIDCKTGRGIPNLQAAICRAVDRLAWVREPFPETWDAVRRALTKSKKRPYLNYTDYRKLCSIHHVTEEGKQDSLAEILHNLGSAINYRSDPRLHEATVLQPEWLTRNVYALMRRAEKQAGVLKMTDVDTVLRRVKDSKMRDYLVRIMERFEIAYPRARPGNVWLIPQALPDVQPEGAKEFAAMLDATRLRYSYQALPEGLVPRAIVRLHDFIEEVKSKKQQWASGAILTRGEARALIRTEPQDRQVMITVTGPPRLRQQLAGLCQSEMRDIHREIPGLDPTEETLVEGTWVATATLEADEKKGQRTGVPTRDRGTVLVDPAGPNNAYSQKAARSNEIWKPTVFISYSKSNVSQRKRLESELKVLLKEGLVAEHWHDRMIDAGDQWNEAIQRNLAEADVVIILVSVSALATDYIRDQEIPKAVELCKAGRTVLVPLILEKCRWEKTELGSLQALPEKGKPINNWNPLSDGWNTVADGLAQLFKKLMEKGGGRQKHLNG